MEEKPNLFKSAVEETEPEPTDEEMEIRMHIVNNSDPDGYDEEYPEDDEEDEDDSRSYISESAWSEFEDCQRYMDCISEQLIGYFYTFSEEEQDTLINALKRIKRNIQAIKDSSELYYE